MSFDEMSFDEKTWYQFIIKPIKKSAPQASQNNTKNGHFWYGNIGTI
jgi:hypothetical protein